MILLLIEKQAVEYHFLQRNYSMNQNQIDYTIDKTNRFLQREGLPCVISDDKTIWLPEESKAYFLEIFLAGKIFSYYEMSTNERRKYIFLTLFYYPQEYLSVNHFLDALTIGKTTFMSDLRKLQTELNRYDLTIQYSRKDGYRLSGEELSIRYAFFRMILEDVTSRDDDFMYRYFLYNEKITVREDYDAYLVQLFHHYQIDLVENRLIELKYILIFLESRIDINDFQLKHTFSDAELSKMKEYQAAETILEQLDVKNSSETIYLCGWILGMALGSNSDYGNDVIIDLVERIVHRFELLSGVRFKDKAAVIQQLYSHFRQTYFRMLFQLPIINPMQSKIFEKYKELYQIVKETLRPISDRFTTQLPEEEIAFLTIHFASLIRNFEEYVVEQKVGVIVCPNGIGSSAIIYNELKEIFPSLVLLGPIETSELYSFNQAYDIIFTTKPNVQLYTLKKPIFVVNPIMSHEERTQLLLDVNNATNSHVSTMDVEHLIGLVEKYSEVYDKEALRSSLEHYMHEAYTASKVDLAEKRLPNQPLTLLDMIQPEFIQLNKKARSWEEAFYLAANPMIEKQVITRNYIDAIIQQTKSEGAYMVIMDQVALPHTVPEAGANQIGMGITTLSSEVNILGKVPVKYIFTLSAVDSKQHLNAMTQFIELLESEAFFHELDHAEDSEQMYQWIREFCL